jgi:hypothetical protein
MGNQTQILLCQVIPGVGFLQGLEEKEDVFPFGVKLPQDFDFFHSGTTSNLFIFHTAGLLKTQFEKANHLQTHWTYGASGLAGLNFSPLSIFQLSFQVSPLKEHEPEQIGVPKNFPSPAIYLPAFKKRGPCPRSRPFLNTSI